MKKTYLLGILLFFVCGTGFAQSVSFEELMRMSTMDDEEVGVFLMGSKGFKWDGKVMLHGSRFARYIIYQGIPGKTETVTVKLNPDGSGTSFPRPVFYYSPKETDINAMLLQVKQANLGMIFKGSDQSKDIYFFKNTLFLANISLSLDKKSGTVQVFQE
jgi:hypothetical protein